jgi:tetratricopeptide (TPR) repeat protein
VSGFVAGWRPCRTPLTLLLVLGPLFACRTTEDMQRDYAQTLTPKKIEPLPTPDTEPSRPVREYKVRAYADTDYQRQSLQWAETIEAQIARANRVLEAQFGVRLVLKEIKSWPRSGPHGSLDDSVTELANLDKGTDVDWVLGFVSSLNVFAATQEQLGRAESPGKHIVLRGMFSLAEVEALNATLSELSQQERDNVTRERRLHKQTLVLLHEWAHSLGAFHELSGEWIMSPYYDVKQSAFSPETLHLLIASLVNWGAKDEAGRQAWARNYRDEVVHFPPALAEKASLDEALAYSERLVTSAASATTTTPSNGAPPPSGHPRTSPPRSMAVATTRQASDPDLDGCFSAQNRSPRSDATLALCRRAAGSTQPSPEALLLLARVLLARKETSEAVNVLVQAETALSVSKAGVAPWTYLAQLYDRADTCTGAERAARHASDDPAALQVLKDCTRQRRAVALPYGATGVPIEREHEYVQAIEEAQRDLSAQRAQQLHSRVQEIEKGFPGSPGPALLKCMVDGHGKSLAQAKASCTAANLAAPEAVIPWLQLGAVATNEGRWEEAGKCYRRAIELDDTNGEAWRTLAAVYIKLRDTKALTELKTHYRSKFGSDLVAAF